MSSHNVKKHEWLSAHLFYNGSMNDLLRIGVAPLVKKLVDEGLINSFFFIKYREKGPHVRLRLRLPDAKQNDRILKLVDKYIKSFYEKHPSRDLAKSEAEISFPMNSIQYIDYDPEVERYGGLKGIAIAEMLFEASSRAILGILKKKSTLTYDESVSFAIQLHLTFSYSFGMTLPETQQFYELIYNMMLPSPRATGKDSPARSISSVFDELYKKQQNDLLKFILFFTPLFDYTQTIEFDEGWLNTWISDCKRISSAFYDECINGQLQLAPLDPSKSALPHKSEWFIYNSYVHMTNNRLGLLNSDESYVSYLIAQSLKDFIALSKT